jgi:hypothetical protein
VQQRSNRQRIVFILKKWCPGAALKPRIMCAHVMAGRRLVLNYKELAIASHRIQSQKILHMKVVLKVDRNAGIAQINGHKN